MRSLSIVIPIYNAEKTIGSLCATLISLYRRAYRLELVLVNDGSGDSSDAVCSALHAQYGDTITYVKLARNFGEHNAVMAGLHHATGDYCVVMDDDFQNPPAEVDRLIQELEKGYDVVYAQYRSKKDSLYRNLGSWLNDRMATVILGKPRDLYLSSFKIMNRFVVNEIVKYTSPEPYIDAIILRITNNIGATPIEHARRTDGSSGYTFRKLIALWGNMVVSFSMAPLRVIGMIGAAISIFGFGYGLIKAYDDLGTHASLSDYESLMAANMVFRGLVMLAVSIVGEYVGRIYMMLSRDPQFVVRQCHSALPKQNIEGSVVQLKERTVRHG